MPCHYATPRCFDICLPLPLLLYTTLFAAAIAATILLPLMLLPCAMPRYCRAFRRHFYAAAVDFMLPCLCCRCHFFFFRQLDMLLMLAPCRYAEGIIIRVCITLLIIVIFSWRRANATVVTSRCGVAAAVDFSWRQRYAAAGDRRILFIFSRC